MKMNLLKSVLNASGRKVMNEYIILIGLIFGLGLGFVIAYWAKGKIVSQRLRDAESEGLRLIEDYKQRADTLLKEAKLEAKDKLFKMKSEFDAETRETRSELKKKRNG